jgi:hypothetical protein
MKAWGKMKVGSGIYPVGELAFRYLIGDQYDRSYNGVVSNQLEIHRFGLGADGYGIAGHRF